MSGEKHNWATFAEFAEGFFERFSHDLRAKPPPECKWIVGPTLARIDVDFLRAEAPFIKEIEEVIGAIGNDTSGSVSTETSRGGAYFLGVRSDVIRGFLMELVVGTDPHSGSNWTIIPFPGKRANEVLQWLLLDWWREHGPFRACEIRLREAIPLYDEHGQV